MKSTWVAAPARRPSPVATIAFEVEAPSTLEAAIAFFRRYCSPDEVFSPDELAGFDLDDREELLEKIDNLESEVIEAEDDAEDQRWRADDVEEELEEAKRTILALEARLEVLRETPGGAA